MESIVQSIEGATIVEGFESFAVVVAIVVESFGYRSMGSRLNLLRRVLVADGKSYGQNWSVWSSEVYLPLLLMLVAIVGPKLPLRATVLELPSTVQIE